MAAKVDSRGGTRPTKVTFSKAGNVPNVGNIPQTTDESHEMHVKMSKKIAQLTKVIFSLNTKNEDFEEIIEGLKAKHNDELERVALESKDKIVHYKQKLELVKEQEALINKLQCLLEGERSDKHQLVADFENYKLVHSEKEEEIRLKYEAKMVEFGKNLTKLKNEFEIRTQQFENARKSFEIEKDNLLSDLTNRHTLEMEKLINAHRVRYDELQNEKVILQKEIDDIKSERTSEVSSRDSELRKLIDENEAKCEKLKLFYQKELSAAKEKYEIEVNEQLEKFKNEEKINQASMKRNEETLKNKIMVLSAKNEKLDSRIVELEMAVKSANEELSKSCNNNDDYSKEVSNLQQELSVADVRLKGLQSEMNILKTKYEEQSKDMLRKSAELGSLEATKISNANTIKDLTLEVDELRRRCNELESERKNLGRKLSASSSEAHLQIRALQRDLEKLEESKKGALDQLMKETEQMKSAFEEKIKSMKEERDLEYSNVVAKHKEEVAELATCHKEEMNSIKEMLQSQQNEVIRKLEAESKELTDQKLRDIENLEAKLKQYESEISRLKSMVEEEHSKSSFSSDELVSRQKQLDEMQSDLERTKNQLISSQAKVSMLERDSEVNKKEYEKEIENAELKLQTSLKDLQADLNQQWAKKLKDECEKIRHTLLTQQREESDAALNQLMTLKEKELDAYKKELQQQISRYQQQVSQLRKDLQNASKENLELLKANSEEIDQQRAKYEDQIAKLKFDHSGEIEILYLENEKRLKGLAEKYDLDLKDLTEKLKSEHNEALAGLTMANRAAMDAVKREAEASRKDQIEELNVKHSEEKEHLRQSLYQHHQVELKEQNLKFEEELDYVKDEVKKIKELRAKEFAVHSSKIEELSDLVTAKNDEAKEMAKRLEELQENVKLLTSELEGKVEEIRKVRREGNINLRRREQQLAKEHQNEVDELTADHLRETQKILAEFNRAKELLKDKIEALQLLLEQADVKYRNRESRPEDLDAIENLKAKVVEQELECQKLVEEKRYFQLELLNRETNFNKIFNSMPNVGVINPLEVSKKKRKATKDQWNLTGRSTMGQSSGSSSPARLEPLQHSKIHDQRLNNSKPLPHAPVKGV